MKTRIQLAGVMHGSKEKTLCQCDLPLVSGVPGMRLALVTPQAGDVPEHTDAFQFRQMCLEVNTAIGEYEQVIYVTPVDRSKQHELNG